MGINTRARLSRRIGCRGSTCRRCVCSFSRKTHASIFVSLNNARLCHSQIAREIMIHKELNHVNVVQMHHYFEDNLNVYMLLEACPRKVSCVSYSLRQFIVPYHAFCIFARKISQFYLSTFMTSIHTDENSTADARLVNYYKPPTDIGTCEQR